MTHLNPHLRFNDGKCREAMNFYQSCLGGKVAFMTVGDSPMAKDMPDEMKDHVMHASLEAGDITLSGSDMMRDKAVVGDNMAIMFNGKSEEEVQTLFSKLSDGGDVFMPLEMQFWGDLFGVVTDKFGIEWALNYHKQN